MFARRVHRVERLRDVPPRGGVGGEVVLTPGGRAGLRDALVGVRGGVGGVVAARLTATLPERPLADHRLDQPVADDAEGQRLIPPGEGDPDQVDVGAGGVEQAQREVDAFVGVRELHQRSPRLTGERERDALVRAATVPGDSLDADGDRASLGLALQPRQADVRIELDVRVGGPLGSRPRVGVRRVVAHDEDVRLHLQGHPTVGAGVHHDQRLHEPSGGRHHRDPGQGGLIQGHGRRADDPLEVVAGDVVGSTLRVVEEGRRVDGAPVFARLVEDVGGERRHEHPAGEVAVARTLRADPLRAGHRDTKADDPPLGTGRLEELPPE